MPIGAGSVFLAREHDERSPLALVPHGRVVDRHLLAGRNVQSKATLDSRHESIAQANVGERAAHHDLVIPPPRAVGVEVAQLDAMLRQVAAGGRILGDRAGRRDVVGGHRVAENSERACASNVLPSGRLAGHAGEERRLPDVCRGYVPRVPVSVRNGKRAPLFVPVEHAGVLLAELLRAHRRTDGVANLRLRGPEVPQVYVLPLRVLPEGLGREVDVHPAREGVGDDEGRGCQVVGPRERVHPALEVPVPRENSCRHEVTVPNGLGDRLRQGTAVSDAGRTAVPDDCEPQLLEEREEPCLFQVFRDDLGAGRKARLDPGSSRQASLGRFPGQETCRDHNARI